MMSEVAWHFVGVSHWQKACDKDADMFVSQITYVTSPMNICS